MRCTNCRGPVLKDQEGELTCLHCGHSPQQVEPLELVELSALPEGAHVGPRGGKYAGLSAQQRARWENVEWTFRRELR